MGIDLVEFGGNVMAIGVLGLFAGCAYLTMQEKLSPDAKAFIAWQVILVIVGAALTWL